MKGGMNMYKFIPIIGITILVAACSSSISRQAKEDLARPINCDTAEEDIRTLESEKASVAKRSLQGITAVAPAGAVIGILTLTEKEKLEVASGVYNQKIDEKIAEIKRECKVGSILGEGKAAWEVFNTLDVNNDGLIVKEELIVIFPNRVVLKEKFKIFDLDGNRQINRHEFIDIYYTKYHSPED